MELWFILFASFCLCTSLHYLIRLLDTKKLPPGPPTVPFLGNLLWLLKSSQDFSNMEPIIRSLSAKYGPIVTLYIGSRPSIFITTQAVAHRALVQRGALFANRPPALETTRIIFSNQHTLSSAPYGSLWRLLRQNFTSLLHPSRLKLYSDGRRWAYNIMKNKLVMMAHQQSADSPIPIFVQDHFQHAMFCLLVYMCFGEKLEEKAIKQIEAVQRPILVNFIRFNVLNFMPRLGKVLFRRLWKELLDIRRNQEEILLPLIRQRQEKIIKEKIHEDKHRILSYVDTLFDLQLPLEDGAGRKFSDAEMVSLCSEFLNGGTDTSTTTLQWVMANLVKHQEIQEKLVGEINAVVKKGDDIREEDIEKMTYLKAIVLETLRRHPPGHFILPRAVTEDTIFHGYDIPRNAMVNFTVAEMGWNPNVWDDPMEFKPERFLSHNGEVVFDIKGVKEIKMMPFGAGRRVCPAISLALLHQQYFVANLIRDFKWSAGDGEEVDLTEKQDFTMVMKNPLRALISPRIC
ncbi:cytochrome P450 89A2-like [Diospyros lotus]|uniref:cytochrome P450 89A2-like n=1 Tax=Diospyros lotus TaxID=55363 RepID=UPI0022553B15|nr:cytochrome P450 89A2-like [Diospyros lotus]